MIMNDDHDDHGSHENNDDHDFDTDDKKGQGWLT